MKVNPNFILTILSRNIAQADREHYLRRKRRMWQTDLNILTRCTLFHRALVVVIGLFLYGSADFCNASDSSCSLQIPSTTIVRSFRQKCYHFIKDEMYWTSARNFCTKYGGRLAKNADAETNDFLSSALNTITWWQNDGVWIGLHDRNKEFNWEWTTGKTGVDEPVSWTNWASGHPSSVLHTRRNCVRMKRSRGKWLWVDTPCETLRWHYRFICEYDFHSSDTESLDATKLEGILHENTDEDTRTGFYSSGIILITLLTLSILMCCICNIYVLCRRRKAGHVGAMEMWPFSVLSGRRTVVARAEPNTYVTLEMLAIRKPAKTSSDVDVEPQENLYCPMDGSSQHQQHSDYLPMGNATNLPGRINTMNETALMGSTTAGYVTHQLSDVYLEPGTITTGENGNEMMGYDIPRSQPMRFEPRTVRMVASDQSTCVEQKDSAQRENTYETIEGYSEPKTGRDNDVPETENKEMVTYASSAERNCMKWGTEEPNPNQLYSEISEADIDSGHIYELLDDVRIQVSLQGSPGQKKL